MLSKNMPHRRVLRQEGASARATERAGRDDGEQLASLEVRGHGSCGEASRLRERLARATMEAKAQPAPVAQGPSGTPSKDARPVPAGESKKAKRAMARRAGG